MTKNLTCIICPLGCSLVCEVEDGKVVSISGNGCKRGKEYAESECVCPKRTVTTTVKTKSGRLVACKTKEPIPKEKMFSLMEIINSLRIDLPIRIGDVIIEDVFGTSVVATENLD